MKKNIRILIYLLLITSVLLTHTISCKKGEDDGQIPITTTLIVNTHVVSNITSTTAIFEGDVVSSGGDLTFDVGFCWSNVTSEPDYSGNYIWLCGVQGSGSFSGEKWYLTPGTTYYVRAYALNSKGIAYGNVISFTTTGSVVGEIIFNPALTYGSLTDVDGNTYKTIKIGTQTWMAENLKTTKYNDGTTIPNVTNQDVWSKLTSGAYCWYINQSAAYKNIYGALYNWYTVKTGKLCPGGWHVPSDAEWTTLTDYMGGWDIAGSKLKETGNSHWIPLPPYVLMLNVTNESGFTALPGGYRGSVWTFYLIENLGYLGLWWSSTESDYEVDNILIRTMNYQFNGITSQNDGGKKAGLSCRCIKN